MYRRILVAVDGSETSLRGLTEAIQLAKDTGASLLLVHVVNALLLESETASTAYYQALADAFRDSGRQILEHAGTLARQAGVPFEQKLVDKIGAHASHEIIAQAKQWNADLIVLGTHGRRGLKRLAMGSDAEVVLRLSPVPVLMIRHQPESLSRSGYDGSRASERSAMYEKLLVPVDGSLPSMLGLKEAIMLAKGFGSDLQLVHVIDEVLLTGLEAPPGYTDKVIDAMRAKGAAVLEAAARVVREHALEPQTVLLEAIGGAAADRIVEQAKSCEADLIVMGTHGRRGLRRLTLGSDAELVVRNSPVPVLLVRADAK